MNRDAVSTQKNMFGSDIIDAAIGLFLIYFLFSVLCSALNEWIIGHLSKLRAKTLESSIESLLACDSIKKSFYDHPLIKSLTEKAEAKPNYISSATFVDALLAVVRETATQAKVDPATVESAGRELGSLREIVLKGLGGTPLKLTLESLLSSAKDMGEARKKLEDWFNEGMDRASGWYKRKAQVCTVILALLVVSIFNVDTFTIARELMNNSKLRATLVASAEEVVKQSGGGAGTTNTLATIEKKIVALQLPIGWKEHTNVVDTAGGPTADVTSHLRIGEDWWMKIGGLLITACALSLGAPFWFDLLGKLVNLRATGKKPEAAKEKK